MTEKQVARDRPDSSEKNAFLLFEDEAAFPQWGTLIYTWPRNFVTNFNTIILNRFD
jgi:hypothetical protein